MAILMKMLKLDPVWWAEAFMGRKNSPSFKMGLLTNGL